MSLRKYSNAPATTLSGAVTAGATSLSLTSVTGLPITYPYILILDRGQSTEEVVLVTAGAGTTLTATRGYDSTTAFAHSAGASVVHGISAIDPREANAHVNATSGVHGLSGALVGVSDTQTLTNKTLGVTNSINGFAASRFMQSDGTGKLSASAKSLPSGVVVGDTDAQTLTNKTITLAANNLATGAVGTSNKVIVSDSFGVLVPGSTPPAGAFVGTTDTQTLTNKTVDLSLNTLTGVKGTAAAGAYDFVVGGIRFAGGSVSVSMANGASTGSAAVTFATAFSATPVVQTTIQVSGLSVNAGLNAAPTTTGATVVARWAGSATEQGAHGATSVTVNWSAIGPA